MVENFENRSEITSEYPDIIQGGMGVGVSNWELAAAVSRTEGGLGVVSGTAINTVIARRLQDGDPSGVMREALSYFPDSVIADEIVDKYFIDGGRQPEEPYKSVPKFTDKSGLSIAEKLNIAGAFAEVWSAKKYSDNKPVGMNLLTKVQPPTMSAIYGAEIAGVDYIIMGAGIPAHIPAMIGSLANNEVTYDKVNVHGTNTEHKMIFDPNKYPWLIKSDKSCPKFFAIVSSHILAKWLAANNCPPDGFVVEGPTAGGHNAPARDNRRDALGQPIYTDRDKADLDKLNEIGLPYWLAGGHASPEGLRFAKEQGAKGIQVGSIFALCKESGLAPDTKQDMIELIIRKTGVRVFTDLVASPTGYPFKVGQLRGTVAELDVYKDRNRVCDLGYLLESYEKSNGDLGWRCPAEPVDDYCRKGGDKEQTLGRKCVCNGLLAAVGMPQVRRRENELYVEPSIVTLGDDINKVVKSVIGATTNLEYTVTDAVRYLRGE